jgi:hypothetical protein
MTDKIPQSMKYITQSKGLRGAPKPIRATRFHALSAVQVKAMLNAGFLKMEIKEFDSNRTTDFRSEYFKRMVRSRAKWTEAMKLNGWTNVEIAKRIRHFLGKKGKSPWDFFRMEYATTSQRPVLTGGKFADFLATRRDISAHFGHAYGRIQSVKLTHIRGLKGVPKKR